MRKRIFVVGSACLMLAACTGGNTQTTQPTAGTAEQTEAHIITKEFPIYADFVQITNVGSLNIELTQGPCSVVAEGDSTLIDCMEFDNDSGSLTLGLPLEHNTDINPYSLHSAITVHVSCPEPRILAVCGGGNLRMLGTIRTTSLHIGGMGTGSIQADSIVCEQFKYEQTNNTKASFAHVECDEAGLLSYGKNATEAHITARRLTRIDSGGSGSLDCHVESPSVEINTTGNATLAVDVLTDELTASVQGTSTLKLSGSAALRDIRKGNQASVEYR